MNGEVLCGTIKAQFPIPKNETLWENTAYEWVQSITKPRVTGKWIYIMLGHKKIRDNEHAKEIINDIERLRGHITRLDFAVDYLGAFPFTAYYKRVDTGKRPIPSMLKSPKGVTVYVGSRESSRMLRIYDKRAEVLSRAQVDIGFELTRVELEVKNKMVGRYRNLFMSDRLDIILNDIQHVYKLELFCTTHEISKPIDIQDKSSDIFAFIQRYRNIIGAAYSIDRPLFLDIIKDKQDDRTKAR